MAEASLGLGARAGAWLVGFPAHFQRKISQGAYRPEIDTGTVAKLRYLATGKYEDPWALPPKSSLKRALARVIH